MAARRKYGELRYSRLGRGRVLCLEQHLKRAEVPSSMMLYMASQSRAKENFYHLEKENWGVWKCLFLPGWRRLQGDPQGRGELVCK